MSLPDGFLDELRSRLSMGQVAGRKVAWDTRRSNQAKGDLWAPCPFHQEKTASFHVDDRKGYYYCFGCHAKGDAISFVRETENVGFVEAVEILAREAGMTVPQRDPQAQQKADRRSQLADVMEQAVRHYRLQLQTVSAGPAREYLEGRGLGPEALDRWQIGYAPDVRRGIIDALTARGVDEGLIVDAGLAARSEHQAYDRFRGRIIFPIRDARGRAIGLGGRAMDPAARAKYLNSPQTELFDKGRSLFNHAPAREAAGQGAQLIVAEGYLDVISLVEAGFAATVAPLGTAVTEDQLRLLWRLHPEPVIALDGDVSGVKAAMRLMDLALPMIAAGQSLRFALMPEGLDPDDVVRKQGVTAMRRIAENADPMVALLWRRETDGKSFDSPERRAALDRSLGDAVRRIGDQRLRTHYADELKRLRWELFNPRRAPTARRRTPFPQSRTLRAQLAEAGRFGQSPEPAARGSALARTAGEVDEAMREAMILATLLRHPALTPRFEGELERLEMIVPEHETIRVALLGTDLDISDPRARLERAVGPDALDRLRETPHVRLSPGLGDDPERAAMCLAEALAKLSASRGARRELEEALGKGDVDENDLWRLKHAAAAFSDAGRRDVVETEYELGPNGARIRRDERAALDALIELNRLQGREARSELR